MTVTAPPVDVYGFAEPVRPVTGKTYDLSGNVLTITDANHHTTTNTYDALNRLKTTTDEAGVQVSYDYDAVGNRTAVAQVMDDGDRVTLFGYDGLNRNTTIAHPGEVPTIFAYDSLNKTSRMDVLGQLTNYLYDARNRLASVDYPGRPVDDRSYWYDAAGRLLWVLEPGKGGLADVSYTYDGLGRVLTETSVNATHRYAYDLAGNRVSVQYGLAGGGNGLQVVSGYDALNRLSSLTEGARTTGYTYDANGNVVLKTLPDGETVEMKYDGMNRQWREQGNSPTGVLYTYISLCDAVGNLCFSLENTAGVPARTLILGYDGADRLTAETVTNTDGGIVSETTYGYDKANNRVSKTAGGVATTYIYNVRNQLTGWTDTAGKTAIYTYDANGNRASRVTPERTDLYAYDVENRLVSLAQGGVQYDYTYDYRTRRVARDEAGAASTVVFSGGTSVQEYTGGGGAPEVEHVRGSDWGGGVGGILYSVRGGSASFAHYDRRGDVTARTNEAGVVTWQASYEADGKRTAEFGATQERQKANTKDEDPTGLLNEHQRYRDLETGVFITRDPAGFVDGPNLYAYVRQNPWSKFDAEGLNETFGWDNWFANWVLPDPVASYREGQRQAAIVGDSNATAAERIGGACGTLGNGISVVIDCIPGIGGLKRKAVASAAEHVIEHAGENALKHGVEHAFEEGAERLSKKADNVGGTSAKEIRRREDMQKAEPMHQPVEAGTDYSNLPEPRRGAQAGAEMTDKTREGVWKINKDRNAGVNRSDQSGDLIVDAEKSQKGVTPPANEGQVDHKVPRSKGGTNSPTNAELLTRKENRTKSNR